MKNINQILALGFAGQVIFSLRFLVQWICSEKRKQSYIPLSFWYLSLGGAVLLFMYALLRHDPVFIAGQFFGIIIYLRNLALILRHKKIDVIAG